jgi:hypothetical protein
MNKTAHFIYILAMVLIVVAATAYFGCRGYQYYTTPLDQRFFMEDHDLLKPSGFIGHGLGFLGTFLMLFGVVIYILKKRYRNFLKGIRLKYLLEFHIFLCTMGPILVIFHSAFKVGGIVSVAFWSMLAIVLSGVIGRYIYVQIPKTIEGRTLSLQEAVQLQKVLSKQLLDDEQLNSELREASDKFKQSRLWISRMYIIQTIRRKMLTMGVGIEKRKAMIETLRQEAALSARIKNLAYMNRLFKYWHVIHQPFTLVLLLIVVFHIGVAFTFGYCWIFLNIWVSSENK